MNVKNADEFFRDAGLSRSRLIELQAETKEYCLNIVDYEEAIRDIGESFYPQLYNLEIQFPPGMAFMKGLFDGENASFSEWELINDLKDQTALSEFAVAQFEEEKFLVGYALANRVSNGILRKLNYKNYMNSVIVDSNFRSAGGIGKRMVRQLLDIFDSEEGNSYLTTWISTGRRLCHVYYPPVQFWRNRGYEPIDEKEAGKIVDAIKTFQEEHGIEGRNYNIKNRHVEEIKNYFGKNIFNEEKDIAILENYYEQAGFGRERWDGIIMVRH